MYYNGFSVQVPQGKEEGQYVALSHGKQYTLRLHNYHAERCDAEIRIHGDLIGIFRLGAHQSVEIERPVNDTGRFTFYRTGSPEARRVGEDEIAYWDKGLIEVTFKPEKKKVKRVVPAVGPTEVKPWWNTPPWVDNTTSWGMNQRYAVTTRDDSFWEYDPVPFAIMNSAGGEGNCSAGSPGVTGLSDHSGQSFYSVSALNYDEDRQTTIRLRLIVRHDDDGPRPLTALETPIPPPV